MTLEQVMELMAQGFNCAQIVFVSAADELGIDREAALKTAACFGGGMGCGEVCGAVTGGLMAIGTKCGHCTAGDADGKAISGTKAKEFMQLFCDEYESVLCKDILGYSLADPQQAAEAKNVIPLVCPELVTYATEILKEVIE